MPTIPTYGGGVPVQAGYFAGLLEALRELKREEERKKASRAKFINQTGADYLQRIKDKKGKGEGREVFISGKKRTQQGYGYNPSGSSKPSGGGYFTGMNTSSYR